jgi:hypothetical protein
MSMRVWPLLLVLCGIVLGGATPLAPTSLAGAANPIIAAPKPPHDCLPCTPYCKKHPNAPQCK